MGKKILPGLVEIWWRAGQNGNAPLRFHAKKHRTLPGLMLGVTTVEECLLLYGFFFIMVIVLTQLFLETTKKN